MKLSRANWLNLTELTLSTVEGGGGDRFESPGRVFTTTNIVSAHKNQM